MDSSFQYTVIESDGKFRLQVHYPSVIVAMESNGQSPMTKSRVWKVCKASKIRMKDLVNLPLTDSQILSSITSEEPGPKKSQQERCAEKQENSGLPASSEDGDVEHVNLIQ